MFDHNSRYADRPIAHVVDDGREVAYARRRMIVDVAAPLLGEIVVRESDRADRLAYDAYGDPTQWWRLADQARVAAVDELTRDVGARLDVPAPTVSPEAP